MTILSPRLVDAEKRDDRECACPTTHHNRWPVEYFCLDCAAWYCFGCVSDSGARHCWGFKKGETHDAVLFDMIRGGAETVLEKFTIVHRLSKG